jgi:inosine/xanthosine triphosphate pyrophosphatase family protein
VVENDTWQLFEDMNRFNPHAETARHAFMRAMEEIEKKLVIAEDSGLRVQGSGNTRGQAP